MDPRPTPNPSFRVKLTCLFSYVSASVYSHMLKKWGWDGGGGGGGGAVTLSHFRRFSSIPVRFPPRESYERNFFSCPTRIAIIDELTALKSDNRSQIYDTGSNIAQSSASLLRRQTHRLD